MESDTIAAIATPAGAGGIGVVKISGPRAIAIGLPTFQSSRQLCDIKSHHLYHGCIVDPGSGDLLDEVLFAVMRGPNTYTREDVVEIQAHGSRSGLGAILELILRRGARLAEPGEFTKRAFLNGRIDLSQAEAVVEMVNSHTTEAAKLAARQLRGGLRESVQRISGPMEELLVEVEAAIDFPEDVEEIIRPAGAAEALRSKVIRPLEELLEHYEEGHIYREGVAVVIVGRPNVGKSSLMNTLLRKERSIVTAVPGTTRDFIEETVNIRGIPLRLIDTAGLRDTQSPPETEGVRLTRRLLDEADLILFMVDGSEPVTDEDSAILDLVERRNSVLVVNKTDLAEHPSVKVLAERFQGLAHLRISARYNTGIEEMKGVLFREITHKGGPAEPPLIVPNARHKIAIERAVAACAEAVEGLESARPPDLVAVDLRDALDALGEIVGVITTDDVLSRIFGRFCIGK